MPGTAAAVARLGRLGRVTRSAVTGWRASRGSNVVLSYHRVSPAAAPSPGTPAEVAGRGMVVTAPRFRRQLAALAERYEVVPARHARERGVRPRVAITFDDGYADNAEVAAPALRELGLPATFFVTTDGLGHRTEFWWDQLEHLLLSSVHVPDRLHLVTEVAAIELITATPAQRAAAFKAVTRMLRSSPPTVVEQALGQLARAVGTAPEPCEAHRRMSIAQLRELSHHPLFEIGSHTCTHAALRALPRAASRRELAVSQQVLGEVVGHPPELLAYPYGAPPSVGRRDRIEARRAGYELAFVNTPGSADRSPRFAVHRLPVVDCEAEELLGLVDAWMVGPGEAPFRRG